MSAALKAESALAKAQQERDTAEAMSRLQSSRADIAEAALAKARAALTRVVFEEHAPGLYAASMPHDMREQCRAALAPAQTEGEDA